MAVVRIVDEERTLREIPEIAAYLSTLGIAYERWEPSRPVAADAPAAEILEAYAAEVERLKKRGGYVTADVIDVSPQTPNLDAMLAKFSREHWHDDDEVRFIIAGRGVFHLHPKESSVVGVEVEAGDLLVVPKGTWHWFDLCPDRHIRAIRLFMDPAGWVPNYTESGIDARYAPLCLGPAYVPPQPR